MLRHWIKYAAAFLFYYTGILWLYALIKRDSSRSELILLGYHRILDLQKEGYDYSQTGLVASVAHFTQQVDYVRCQRVFISMQDLVAAKSAGKLLPKKACMITLDGWKDSYDHAFPILRTRKVPAAVFITTDFIGTHKTFWHTQLAYLLLTGDMSRLDLEDLDREIFPENLIKKLAALRDLGRPLKHEDIDGPTVIVKGLNRERIDPILDALSERLKVSRSGLSDRRFLMSWEEAKEMSEHAFEFGSHSHSHRIMTRLPMEEVKEEIVKSKQEIEGRLGAEARVFACPDGECNSQIEQMILDAGYTMGLFRFGAEDKLIEKSFTLKWLCIHDGMCTTPWGQFSKCLFAFELSGMRDVFPL